MFKKKIYIKNNLTPFPISRTKVDLFFDCKRCFFFDLKFGNKRPHGTPLVLNNRIIQQVKKEFDFFREKKKPHPEIIKLERNFIPSNHENLQKWKNSFNGVSFIDSATNLKFHGTIDDLWFDNQTNKHFIVIFKSTSRKDQLNHSEIWEGYWKQLSFYCFLLSKNSVEMSQNGLILYVNVLNEDNFEKKIKLDFNLFEQILDFSWIENTISNIHELLNKDDIPDQNYKCKFCNYFNNVKKKNK